MGDQAGGLVDSGEVVVLVQQREVEILRLYQRRPPRRDDQRDDFAAVKLGGGFADRVPVEGDVPLVDEIFRRGSRQGKRLGDRDVEPFAGRRLETTYVHEPKSSRAPSPAGFGAILSR